MSFRDKKLPYKNETALKDRIEELIGAQSVRAYAAQVGVSDTMVRKYLKGGVPGLDVAVRICENSGVNLEWFATGEGEKYVNTPETSGNDVPKDSEKDPSFGDEFALVDGYHVTIGEIGCSIDELKVRRRLAFRHKWLEWKGFNADDLKIFFVQSYLEGGTISGGDSVMINTADTKPADGVFAININDSILIRWFSVRVDGSVEVYKDINHDASEVISQDAFAEIKILGRVVWLGKDFS